ncbi:MAG TPA: hypothetical protein PLT65_04370 [Bacilli bacterium]|nr:hypothetical protein [Bacilli bacterium]
MVNKNFLEAKIYKNKNNKQIMLVLKKRNSDNNLIKALKGKTNIRLKFMK